MNAEQYTLIIKRIAPPRRKCGIAILLGRKIKVTRNNKFRPKLATFIKLHIQKSQYGTRLPCLLIQWHGVVEDPDGVL